MLQVLMASTYLKSVSSTSASLVYNLDATNFGVLPPTGAYVSSTQGSNYFPTSSYLGCGTALTLGTTCTFECWFRTTSDPATSKFVLIGGSGNRGLNIYNGTYGQGNYSATVIRLDWETAGDVGFTVPTMSANTWYHLAVTFNAGTATLWLNGTRSSSGTVATGFTFQSQTYRIGAWVSQAIYSDGVYISNARLTTTAVYDITQTTITVPTEPLTAVTGTQLLLNSATKATAYTDSSASPITMTATGSVSWNAITPFTTAGNYPINVVNPNSRISWNAASGGVFRVTTASSADFLTFGPNYGSAQAFTVGMAYKWNGVTAGRLLNANSATPDFLMGLWGSSGSKMNIAYADAFVGSSADTADTAWHFIWFTNTGSAGASKAKSYIATSTAPSATYGTGATNNGFNGLRLFGRYSSASASTEPVDADIGFVKVWNGELSLAEIQAEHAAYKTRFGY